MSKPCPPNVVAADYQWSETLVECAGHVTQLVPADPTRVLLAVTVTGPDGSEVWISTNQYGGLPFTGIQVNPVTASTIAANVTLFEYAKWGPIVGAAWYATVFSGSTMDVTVWSMSYRPGGG